MKINPIPLKDDSRSPAIPPSQEGADKLHLKLGLNLHSFLGAKGSEGLVSVRLQSIRASDIENLRVWKNTHRHSFFHKEIISPENQVAWYHAYASRGDDFMFLVHYADEGIGCIGFRLLNGKADVYNAILGSPEHAGKGIMSLALRLLCSFARQYSDDIGLNVLRENPAVGWYLKNGFVITREHTDHFEMHLDWNRFVPVTLHENSN